jgi:hypothetical protein
MLQVACPDLTVTSSGRAAAYDLDRCRHAEPPPRPESELGLQIFARPNSVRVTRPRRLLALRALAPCPARKLLGYALGDYARAKASPK